MDIFTAATTDRRFDVFNPESLIQCPVPRASSTSTAGTVALHTPYNRNQSHLHVPVTINSLMSCW